MTTVQEIEKAIDHLPKDHFFELIGWIKSRFADVWDAQIEADANAGKLDFLADEALAEFRAGKTSAFPN